MGEGRGARHGVGWVVRGKWVGVRGGVRDMVVGWVVRGKREGG